MYTIFFVKSPITQSSSSRKVTSPWLSHSFKWCRKLQYIVTQAMNTQAIRVSPIQNPSRHDQRRTVIRCIRGSGPLPSRRYFISLMSIAWSRELGSKAPPLVPTNGPHDQPIGRSSTTVYRISWDSEMRRPLGSYLTGYVRIVTVQDCQLVVLIKGRANWGGGVS